MSESCIDLGRCKPLLGTLVDIRVRSPRQQGNLALNAAFAEIGLIHQLMSFQEPDSELSRLNRAPVGKSVRLNSRTIYVLRRAMLLCAVSRGAFDCSASHRAPEAPRSPRRDNADILILAGRTATKTRAGVFDLSGIAKGFAVDRAIAILRAHAVSSGLVNAGGDLRHFGDQAITVLVRDPKFPERMAGSVSLCNAAMATSATTGLSLSCEPVPPSLFDTARGQYFEAGLTATVSARTCLIADALTKIVLGASDIANDTLKRFGARAICFEGAM